MSDIAVVVPVHNRKDTTLNYLRQLPEIGVAGVILKPIIVDDGSTDGTGDAIRAQYPDVTVLNGDGNLWWTGAVRMGAEYALRQGYEHILIMNDDLDLDNDFLVELLKVAEKDPNALVSSIKLNKKPDGTEQIITAGFKEVGWLREVEPIFFDQSYSPALPEVIQCEMLTGSSLLIPAAVFQKIGQFDNARFPHGFGDFEFTLRASQAGFKCLVATKSRIFTEHNQNYTNRYLVKSTRMDYMRNLFNNTKFGYGFISLYYLSCMRKPYYLGIILYCRRSLGLLRRIFFKIVLPNSWLKKMFYDPHVVI